MNNQDLIGCFFSLIYRIFKIILFLYIGITLVLLVGYFALDSMKMINQQNGLPAAPPINLTEAIPTAELGKYPYHAESGMLVYFYSQGSRTEIMPPNTTCWGLKVNDSASTIASFSTQTSVTVVNGACTFYSLTEVYDSLVKSYPNIGWVLMVDNQVVSAP